MTSACAYRASWPLGRRVSSTRAAWRSNHSGGGLLAEPSRCDHREGVEGGAERLADKFQAVEVAGGGQDVGRVGALAGAGLEQAAVLARLEDLVQEDLVQEEPFGPAGSETTA